MIIFRQILIPWRKEINFKFITCEMKSVLHAPSVFTQGTLWSASGLLPPCSRPKGTWLPLRRRMQPRGSNNRYSLLLSSRCRHLRGWRQPAWPPQQSQLCLYLGSTFCCFLLSPPRIVEFDSPFVVISNTVTEPEALLTLNTQNDSLKGKTFWFVRHALAEKFPNAALRSAIVIR